jgi:hypothetical protein
LKNRETRDFTEKLHLNKVHDNLFWLNIYLIDVDQLLKKKYFFTRLKLFVFEAGKFSWFSLTWGLIPIGRADTYYKPKVASNLIQSGSNYSIELIS